MKNAIIKNNLYLITALGIVVAMITVVRWSALPVLQRMVGLFFLAIVLHLWEEGKYPGGFTTMITETLSFTARSPHFGEGITSLYVLFITLVPLLLPNVTFLGLAPMILGVFEAVAHLAATKLFKLRRFYSPGLVTALVALLPIAIYAIVYTVQHSLLPPVYWLFSILYMLGGLLLAQQVVVRMSGMKYTEFLRNVRGTLFTTRK